MKLFNLFKRLRSKFKHYNMENQINIALTLKQAKKLYKNSNDSEFKELLEINFGKNKLVDDITELIKDFSDVVDYIKENNRPLFQVYNSQLVVGGLVPDKVFAGIKLQMIEFCLNEGKIPKLGESRHYPWFDIKDSGLVFAGSACRHDYSRGTVAYFKSSKLAQLAGKKFIKIYEDYLK